MHFFETEMTDARINTQLTFWFIVFISGCTHNHSFSGGRRRICINIPRFEMHPRVSKEGLYYWAILARERPQVSAETFHVVSIQVNRSDKNSCSHCRKQICYLQSNFLLFCPHNVFNSTNELKLTFWEHHFLGWWNIFGDTIAFQYWQYIMINPHHRKFNCNSFSI